MRTRRYLMVGVIFVVVAVGALASVPAVLGVADDPPSPTPQPVASPGAPLPPGQPATYESPDQRLADTGAQVPGFGGLYLDRDNSIVHVFMLDHSQLDAAKQAAESILGVERFSRKIREVRTEQAQYTIVQLSAWYEHVRMLSVPGIVSTDLSEGENRLAVGVEDTAAQAAVQAELAKLGIPLEAVIVRIEEPTRLL